MKKGLALILIICVYLGAPCSNALGEYALTREAMPAGFDELFLCSMSPDARTLVFADFKNREVLLVDRATGAQTKVFADYANSVEDTYSHLESAVNRMSMRVNGAKSLVWSPDGRYIAFTSWKDAMQYNNFIYDLIVIDARTGAARLYQTYADKFGDPSYGAIISNCFSADSKYLYSVRYSPELVSRSMLMRLNMETGECEDLKEFGYKISDGIVACDLKDLAIAQTGEIIGVLDVTRASMLSGLYVAKQSIFGWQASAYHVNPSEKRARALLPRRVFASERSAYGVLQYSAGGDNPGALAVFDADNEFAGFDKPLGIYDLSGGTATRVSVDDFVKCVVPSPYNLGFESSLDVLGIASVYTCALSPDGTRAIILASYQEDYHNHIEYALLMLDLKTLEYEPITSVDITQDNAIYCIYDTIFTTRFESGIEWPSDEYVLMNTEDHDCQIFRLTQTDK